MRWLLHGNLTPAVAENLRKREDHPTTLAEAGLAPDAPVAEVLKLAHTKQLDLMTTEAALAEAPYELDFWFGRSIVHLVVNPGEVEQDDAVDRLFTRYKRLTPGRLYIVTNSRVKIRQLPSRHP
jgi:hypothetical protein